MTRRKANIHNRAPKGTLTTMPAATVSSYAADQKCRLCENARATDSDLCEACRPGRKKRLQRTGRFSEALGDMRRSYLASLNDPSLLDLREPIAVMDMAAKRLMERLQEKDGLQFRKEALALCIQSISLMRGGKAAEGLARMVDLQNLLQRGASEDIAMNNLVSAADLLAKRIEKAWEIRLAKRNAMSREDLETLMQKFVTLMRSELPEAIYMRMLKRIDSDIMANSGRHALLGERVVDAEVVDGQEEEA
jgi:hypothetical protein